MRRAALAGCLLFCLTGAVQAEVVRVRSGEHADFSRLVFEFGEPIGWELNPADDGYAIRLARQDVSFDLSRVFRLIPRDRIQAVTATAGTGLITLQSDCDCHADAFEISPGKLVVDIKDGPGPEPLPETASAVLPVNGHPSAAATEVLTRPPLTLIGGFLDTNPAETTPASSPLSEHQLPQAASGASAAELQKMLLQELGRAAAQGLVEADVAPPPVPAPIAPAPDRTQPHPPPEPPGPPGLPGIRIETSVDRAGGDAARPPSTERGDACLPRRVLDIATWGDDRPAAAQIGEARSALVGEFDAVGADELRHLIRSYLYFGFGAEAKAVAGSFPVALDEGPVLRAIAEIMDDGAASDPALFAGQLGCDSQVALWAALSVPKLSRGEQVDRDAIVSAFSALPLHLRRHLGPGLARRFIDAGDRETATRLHNAITRAAGDHGAGAALTEARLDIASGELDTAAPALRRIVAEDGALSPEALIDLLEAQIAAEEVPLKADLATAQALAYERRGGETGRRLMRAFIRGSALSGDFDAAFEALDRMPLPADPDLRDDTMRRLVDAGSDLAFLSWVFVDADRRDLSGRTALAAADRLTALGFPDQADSVLPPLHARDAPELRQVRARIALARGDWVAALELLDGLPGVAADALRGTALQGLGRLTEAQQHFQAADDEAALDQVTWQTGDWAEVAERGRAAQKAWARLRLQRPEGPAAPTAEPSLGHARALLKQSTDARRIVAALLTEAALLRQ